jgi:pimeloyl-ACP methyl ester carboxylesterase
MQQFFYLINYCIVTFIIVNILSFIASEYQILRPDEEARLKEGKTFWEWTTPEKTTANIHYIERGTGSNHILLVHGFRCNTYTWRHLIDPLAEAGFHVWCIDLLGFGLSDKPYLNYSLELFIKQIHDFMDGHEIPKAHFIGNSMGGGLSITMALDFPSRVNSLTLISPLGYPIEIPLYISIGKHLSMFWTPFLGSTMIRKGLEQIVYNKDSIQEEQVEAYRLPYSLAGGAAAALSTLKSFDNQKLEDLSRRYPEIGCPLFVIWGNNDTLIPIEHFKLFCKDFPSAKKLLIEECGHIPQEEKPEEIKASVLSFLREIYNPSFEYIPMMR